MTNISLSIPSRSRNHKLAEFVKSVTRQRLLEGHKLDVVIVLDGCSKSQELDQAAASCPFPVQIIEQEHIGISAAKNIAADAAKSDLLLYLNDDLVLPEDFVEAHIAAATQSGMQHSILGKATWAKQDNWCLMDAFVENTRAIFFYGDMQPGKLYDFRHAWNLNLAIPRKILDKIGGFNENLRPYMYSDLESAWRMQKLAHRVIYNPQANALHFHRYTFESYIRREIMLGVMAPVLWHQNRECFQDIFKRSLSELAKMAETAMKIDKPDGIKQFDFLRKQLSQPCPDQSSHEYLESLYMAHLPLKRRAFRYGLIDTLNHPDTPWQERISIAKKAELPSDLFCSE